MVNQYPTHQIITELHRLAAGNVSEQAVAMPLAKLFKGKDIDLKSPKSTLSQLTKRSRSF
ncbi:hypothetical protein PO124_33980 [Bacillus licheniformis]|nr:hypothetical protein [Bacillus licheniformis]